jgi:hypothetical protein
MAEVEREVRTFHVERQCDVGACSGVMRKDRDQTTQLKKWSEGGYVGEPLRVHTCNACGAKAEYDVDYPKLVYRFTT